MFIVDTQVHIWKEETPDRPWIPGARERMRLNGHREAAFTYQECISLMDEAGVWPSRAVRPASPVTIAPELGPTLEKAVATVRAGQTAVVNVHLTR